MTTKRVFLLLQSPISFHGSREERLTCAVRCFSFEKHKNRTFSCKARKRKTIFASRFCSLNCVAWLYINFSKLAFWFALYAFQIAKIPEGALMSVSKRGFRHLCLMAAKAVNESLKKHCATWRLCSLNAFNWESGVFFFFAQSAAHQRNPS